MTHKEIKIYDEISTLDLVAPNLWEVDRCFSNETLSWLQSIYENENNEFIVGGLKKRLQLKYGSKDFSRLNQLGLDMLSAMQDITGENLTFIESKYWIDMPQFGCQTHSDEPDLYCCYQVYLYSTNQRINDYEPSIIVEKMLLAEGAEFLHVDPPYQISFRPNRGYININSDLKKHWVPGRWDTRISVMFQYARV